MKQLKKRLTPKSNEKKSILNSPFSTFNFLFIVLLLFIATACSDNDDDPEYKGKNELFMTTESTNILEDSEDGSLTLNLMLTKAPEKDITLKLSLKNNEYNNVTIASFSQNFIEIKAGEKKARVILKSNNKGILTSERIIEVGLENSTDPSITLNKTLLITVKPGAQSVILTEEQLKLIEGYKKNGLDITPWIGLIPVKVRILYPGGGNFAPFLDKYEKTIEGKTAITLSVDATADKAVLRMADNALGLENYLYEIIQAETILNTEFWAPQPAPQQTIKLIGLSKDRAETFNLALDHLVLDKINTIVSFVSNDVVKDIFKTKITGIDFDYTYSAWDRMKKLIDEGNQDAIDANEQGGTVFPGYILNQTSIDTDQWESGNWTQYTSSFNTSTGEMKFIFNLDHLNASDYIRFEVTYSPIK